ncbi:DUF6221 family protein [Streptomyces luteogriseus]|uniref:DUF6221 family protein n=1 Tax=Streptomyces luteogriseus TaxID=68233 RepID=UPI0036E35F9A
MDELVGWLRAQLDEDERVARAAADELEGPELGGEWRYDGQYVETARERTMVAVGSQDLMEPGCGEHIARHDPARVLREIDAKRQLLDDYETTARIRDEAAARIKAAGDHPDPKDLDTWDRAQREAAIFEGPVKLAASPSSDRPGYREEWRP